MEKGIKVILHHSFVLIQISGLKRLVWRNFIVLWFFPFDTRNMRLDNFLSLFSFHILGFGIFRESESPAPLIFSGLIFFLIGFNIRSSLHPDRVIEAIRTLK